MRRIIVWIVVCTLLAACSGDSVRRVVVSPQVTSAPSIPEATQEQLPAPSSAGWRTLMAGVEFQELKLDLASMQVLRIDPARLRVRVAYDDSAPGTISEWQQALQPVALINGGYFDKQGRATALTVFDGVSAGVSYEGFGGMLTVDAAGNLAIRSLKEQPYDSSETFAQALQSAPMLVLHGERVPQPNDDGDRARRSVIATDSSGHLLLLACGWPELTLSELSRWLVDQAELDIVNALNLDGGSSTGLAVDTPELSFTVNSLVRVPQVLVIEQR